jgi:hypothetical protein
MSSTSSFSYVSVPLIGFSFILVCTVVRSGVCVSCSDVRSVF